MAATLKTLRTVAQVLSHAIDDGPPIANYTNNRGGGFSFSIGTGANSANKWAIKSYTIAPSANQDIDLTTVTAPDQTVPNFSKIRGILLELPSNIANQASGVKFGPLGAANPVNTVFNATTEGLTVHTGGFFLLHDPTSGAYGISGSNKVLRITNLDGSNSATVYVTFIGE